MGSPPSWGSGPVGDGPEPDTTAAAGGPGDAESVARAICLRLLSHAPRTRAQLDDALRRRGASGEVRDRVLGRFTEVGLIDDAAFADAWVQSRHLGRGLAGRALAVELRRRGVDEVTVTEAVGRLRSDDELATAQALIERRLPSTRNLDPTVRARRLLGVLARKGYSSALAYRVVREALESEGEHADDLPVADPDDP